MNNKDGAKANANNANDTFAVNMLLHKTWQTKLLFRLYLYFILVKKLKFSPRARLRGFGPLVSSHASYSFLSPRNLQPATCLATPLFVRDLLLRLGLWGWPDWTGCSSP